MKTYIDRVFFFVARGMERGKAIKIVASTYCLTRLEVERLDSLTTKG